MKSEKLTPAMKQYFDIKKKHPDSILLFRMGDFYEMFYSDAEIASKILGIVITSRNKNSEEKIPLAGFPYHALENYAAKLLKAGYKIAICEQTEDPKKAKGIVKREVVEVVTPGTSFSPVLVEDKKNNYLLAISFHNEIFGISYIDLTTGEFYLTEVYTKNDLINEIERINPSEIIIEKERIDFISKISENIVKTFFDSYAYNYDYAYDLLTSHFKVKSLEGYGIEKYSSGIIAAGVIIDYLKTNQKNKIEHINSISLYNMSEFMFIDEVTKRNLELTASYWGDKKEGSLLNLLDETVTAMGGRMLRKWLNHPLLDIKKINDRHNSVDELYQRVLTRQDLNDCLKNFADIERIIAKIGTEKANCRDLVALKKSLNNIPYLIEIMNNIHSLYLVNLRNSLETFSDLVELLERSIIEDAPLSIKDGGIIKDGYNEELDELKSIARDGKKWILEIEQRERERTGINSLKIRFNNVFGYYIELTKSNLNNVPENYIRKQTIANGERFITDELKQIEDKILNAEEKINQLEYEIFLEIRKKVAEYTEKIQNVAKIIAEIDVLLAFSKVAAENNYVRPIISDDNNIEIRNGRHPVVEKLLKGDHFIPNDLILNDEERILIITGPNMAGKSTYLRQIGLIVLLAQIGSFVPAEYAKLSIVDRIFTRVGASDNLLKGQSTFLVEMLETANILHNATERSLILLDEIGRGTSTFDGLSIAWAVAEFIHNNLNAPKTLFATHYHELTELEYLCNKVKNYNVKVKEWKDEIIFLRKIERGSADQSYGIEVAKLAGMPLPVLKRAREILKRLEETEVTVIKKYKKEKKEKYKQLTFLDILKNEKKDTEDNKDEDTNKEVIDYIKNLDINNITPIEALKKLNDIKEMIKG